MSKVKYIIEVDKEDIDIFLTKMNERYITNYYEGENTICGRVLLSTFKTATPITESDDCVSIQAVNEILLKYVHSEEGKLFTEFLISQIKDLPPVLPKREQSEWIEVHPLQEDDGGAYMCSKCRCGHPYIAPHWKYCPNCGAEMR